MSDFIDPLEQLSNSLQRLDLLVHREILRLRASYQLSLDEFRGLYISDEQVNQLINQSLHYDGSTSALAELTMQAEALRATEMNNGENKSRWRKLVEEFSLSLIEEDILLLAIAPEIDLKYETLYAYLNNDVTRKWPTFDLALRVCSFEPEQRSRVRKALMPQMQLFSSGLLEPVASATEGRSWLATGFSPAPVISQYLSGIAWFDPHLIPFAENTNASVEWDVLGLSSEQLKLLRRLPILFARPSVDGPIVVITGRDTAVGRAAAEAVCRELSLTLLCINLAALRAAGENMRRLTRAISLQQRLHPAGLFLYGLESLLDKDGKPTSEAHELMAALRAMKRPVFIACESEVNWRELLIGHRTLNLSLGEPEYDTRLQLWERELRQRETHLPAHELRALADRFTLTTSQISSAVMAAFDARGLIDEQSSQPLDAAALFEAARAQSDQALEKLAVKVRLVHAWDDVILPAITFQRLKEIAAAIKHRHVVYAEWGFERRIAYGKGIKALFAGASGTGKTMTAGVIARELGLDVYKIDLSAVVSKYIGETEKNLDRIFRAAHCSNAILFFDEADALFGKRSETKDAHDRYANIEVAYLLQKIEDHEGVVILASNLSKNIDEAFSRRMHYLVEFPLPEETQREKLWRGMFPPEAPLARDVDFHFLAKQFPLAGGDIRNVALDAAFLAAQDGQVITIKQIIKAMARQMMKQGKIASPTDFKQYHEMLA